jgi:hypothetical protein
VRRPCLSFISRFTLRAASISCFTRCALPFGLDDNQLRVVSRKADPDTGRRCALLRVLGEHVMNGISLLPGEAAWRSRKVQYYSGDDWASIQGVLPEFELRPFTAGENEPSNPFLQTVVRKPLSIVERHIPVGIVSHTYSLVPHREIAALCRKGIIEAGIDATDLRYEVGLSELGEWMNLRICLPDAYDFVDAHGNHVGLRLECFNSVDGLRVL